MEKLDGFLIVAFDFGEPSVPGEDPRREVRRGELIVSLGGIGVIAELELRVADDSERKRVARVGRVGLPGVAERLGEVMRLELGQRQSGQSRHVLESRYGGERGS